VIAGIVKSIWKPWGYLSGLDEDEERSPAPPSAAPETEPTTQNQEERQAEVGSTTASSASPGEATARGVVVALLSRHDVHLLLKGSGHLFATKREWKLLRKVVSRK
jgi:hypothetical protein